MYLSSSLIFDILMQLFYNERSFIILVVAGKEFYDEEIIDQIPDGTGRRRKMYLSL